MDRDVPVHVFNDTHTWEEVSTAWLQAIKEAEEAEEIHMLRISDIEFVTLNGKAVKRFKIHQLTDGAYLFLGNYSAPASVENCDLAQYMKDLLENV